MSFNTAGCQYIYYTIYCAFAVCVMGERGGGQPERRWNSCFPTSEHSTWQCLDSTAYTFIKREYVLAPFNSLGESVWASSWCSNKPKANSVLTSVHEWVWTGSVNRHFPGKCVSTQMWPFELVDLGISCETESTGFQRALQSCIVCACLRKPVCLLLETWDASCAVGSLHLRGSAPHPLSNSPVYL